MSSASMPLSRAASAIPEALSIKINQMVYDLRRAGEDVITLSLGEAFFDLPTFDFTKLDINKGYHYSDSQGLPKLRQKIAAYYGKHYGSPVDGHSEVLISAGSKPLIYMSMLTAMNPGDELLIHEPAWLSYQQQATLLGVTSRFIPFDVRGPDFHTHFSDKTRMVVINNPNNPAGRRYDAAELAAIYESCRARDIYLMVDEAYSDFAQAGRFTSAASLHPQKEGVIVVNSLSKNMGISGWRIGYVIANASFISALLKVNQHLITCAPTILLQYCERYFDDIIAATFPQLDALGEKRRRVTTMMDEIGLTRLDGDATFYFFVSIGNFPGTSFDFAMKLLVERQIAVVPGSAYGASTDRFIRIGIGAESEERIEAALRTIKAQTELNDFDADELRREIEHQRIYARS
jgi:aspartate/methionine/tyrosine aminotransferase